MVQIKKPVSSVLLPAMASISTPEESMRQSAAGSCGITPLCGSFSLNPNNPKLLETLNMFMYPQHVSIHYLSILKSSGFN